MPRVTFKEDECKGCGLCVSVCPKKIIEMAGEKINRKGYYPARCVDMDKCTGCAMCAVICPDVVIKVER